MHRPTLEQTPLDSENILLEARQTSRVLDLREMLASCTRNFPSPERIPRNHAVLNSHLSPRRHPSESLLKSTATPQRLSNLMRISGLSKSLLRVLRTPRTFRMSETLLWTGIRMIVTSTHKDMNFQTRNKSTPQRQSGSALFLMTRRWFSTPRSLRWRRKRRNLSQYRMMPYWEAPFVRHSLAQSSPHPRNDFVTLITTKKLCGE